MTSSSAALPSACPDEASGAPFTLSGLSAVCRNFCARSRTRGAYVHQAAMFTRRRLPHPMRHGGAHWGHGVYRTQTVRRLWLSVPASAGRRVMSSRRVPARRRMLSRGKPQRQLPRSGVAGAAPTDRSADQRSPDAAAQTCSSGIATHVAAGRRRPNVPTRDQPETTAVLPFHPHLFGICSTSAADSRRSTGKLAHHHTARSLPAQQAHRLRSSARPQILGIGAT